MILPGTRKVKLDSIVVPKGFRERKKAAHIPSRMESIKRHGLINLIVIQDRTRKLLAGGDRLTALLGLKVKRHEVRIFQGTEEEFEALQLAENIERRHNDDIDALTKRYVELTTGEIEKAEEEAAAARCETCGGKCEGPCRYMPAPDHDELPPVEPESEEPRSVGRPKTSKGKAREAVAAATGKTPEAIRQAEKRATAKEKAAEQAQAPAPAVDHDAPPLETYGLPLLSDDDAYQVVVAQGELNKLESALGKALEGIARRLGDGTLAQAICNVVTAPLYQLLNDVRAAYPRAVCPSCKRRPARLAKCPVCAGTGFVGVTAWLGAADELRLGGDKAMVSDGKGGFVPYAREVAKGEEQPKASKPAKGARRLRITDENGQEIPTE